MVDYLTHLEDFRLDYNMTVVQVYEEVTRVSFGEYSALFE